jgi:hypothetical protein
MRQASGWWHAGPVKNRLGRDRVARRALRRGAAVLLAAGLAGCLVLPATYVADPVRDLPREQRAVLHAAFREYLLWAWVLTFVELDGRPIETWIKEATRLELAPGTHRIVVQWEMFLSMGTGSLHRRRCAVELELAAGHDYHVLSLEDAAGDGPEPTMVIEDRAPGREDVTLRLPCTNT